VKEIKPAVRYVLWLAAAFGLVLLAIKTYLFTGILRSDGASALAAQVKSDSVETLWLLLWISLLAAATVLFAKLIVRGLRSARHTPSATHRPQLPPLTTR
jgi:hypothetical protein